MLKWVSSTHTSDSLKAITVTISVFKSDPGYDYKLKYIPAPQYWDNFGHQLLTYLMNMNLTHIKKLICLVITLLCKVLLLVAYVSFCSILEPLFLIPSVSLSSCLPCHVSRYCSIHCPSLEHSFIPTSLNSPLILTLSNIRACSLLFFYILSHDGFPMLVYVHYKLDF